MSKTDRGRNNMKKFVRNATNHMPDQKEDSWGNIKWSHKGIMYRVKFNKTVWRLERRTLRGEWRRITSEYYVNTTMGTLECLDPYLAN